MLFQWLQELCGENYAERYCFDRNKSVEECEVKAKTRTY